MMDGNPTFSIVIPAYNRERFIAATIESALAQTLTPDEVIVVDDGSTDRTVEIAEEFSPPVRVIRIDNNGAGPSRPRNVGIDAAQSRFITLLDSDDVLEPSVLQRHREVLCQHPHVGLIANNYYTACFSENWRDHRRCNESSTVARMKKTSLGDRTYWIESSDAYLTYCRANYIKTPGTTVPKTVCQTVGGFDESLRTSNDFDFFIRVLAHHDMAYIDHPLQTILYHDGNISAANLERSFQQEVYLNHLRVLERELDSAKDGAVKHALHAGMSDWLSDLAYGYRNAGQYRRAWSTYAKCFRQTPFRWPAVKNMAKVPWCWLLGRAPSHP